MDNSNQLLLQSNTKIDNLIMSKNEENQTIYPPVCQICGLLIQIDNSIDKINDIQYRQLGFSLAATRDEIETITTTSEVDMELSLDPSMNSELMRELSSKSYEPLFIKSVPNNYNNIAIVNSAKIRHVNSSSSNLAVANMSNISNPNTNANNNNNNGNDMFVGWNVRLNKTSALFDLISTNTNIDHPLCEECADQLLSQLDSQCKLMQKEQSEYTNLLNKLYQQSTNNNELNVLENELKNLELEEKELIEQLEFYDKEEKKLKEQIEMKTNEEEKLIEQEEKYLIEYYNNQRALIKLEEKQQSLENQLKQTKIHYNRLKTTNVLNATFHIWHSGPFGTINYFRLGRLSENPVEWDELNAGLGQVMLLLQSLATKVKLEFKRFKLVPFGNFSYIEAIENVATLNVKKGEHLHMYGAGGFKYYFDWDKKFDFGMVAFLDCLEQLENKIKTLDSSFSMPYPINGHKLEDKKTCSSYSIRFHNNSHEEWTKALKYMLTNLKWSLAWIASQYE